ncbi:MAG: DUF6249 domain-containing protein [Bacteroidia bacterium]|nr:DUF6249 domain-containing protein [Bacteroidia bacterium]
MEQKQLALDLVRQLGLILTPLVIFYAIYGIVREYYSYQTRRRLIEQGLTEGQLRELFGKEGRPNEGALSSLKWGLMVLALGLSLFVAQPIVTNLSAGGVVSVTLGLMFSFGGAALVAFYLITRTK